MSIKNELDVIRQTWIPQNASKVRQAIHDILIKTYDTASENGNANMEVEIARGTHPNLRSRLEEVDNKQKQTASQLAQTTNEVDDLQVRKAEKEALKNTNTTVATKADKSYVDATNTRIDDLIIPSGNANVEVTDAHTSTRKDKSFGTIRNRFEEIEEDTYYPIKNEIINGDFSDGTNNWTEVSADLFSENNTLQVVGDGNGSTPYALQYTDLKIVENHKIYLGLKWRVTNSDATHLRARFSGSTGGTLYAHTQVNSGDKEWYTLSKIIDIPTNLTGELRVYLEHYYQDVSTLDKTMEVQNVMVIDLTKTYGSGNEPTVAEMEQILNKYPNSWFDGIKNLLDAVEILDMKRMLLHESYARNEIIGTKKEVSFNSNGTVNKVTHRDLQTNDIIREDAFTYTSNKITEIRKVYGTTITFIHHLDTLETEVF